MMYSTIIQEVIDIITQDEYDRLYKEYYENYKNRQFDEHSLLYMICSDYKGINILLAIDKLKTFTNYKDINGYTALMIAYKYIEDFNTLIEITKLLIDTKSLQNINGWTALMIGYEYIRDPNTLIEITKLLIDTKCLQNNDGWTALMCAYEYINYPNIFIEITELLIDSKCLQNNDGWTALMCAYKNIIDSYTFIEITKLLIDSKYLINDKKFIHTNVKKIIYNIQVYLKDIDLFDYTYII